MLTKNIKNIFAIFLFLFLIGIVSSEGCCFSPSSGMCSMNAESASCLTNEGEFFASPSCSESVCDLGCCVLGGNTEFVTSRTCELNSRVYGFDYNWQLMDETSCMALRKGGQQGACLFGGDYEKNCKITTLDKCSSGDFYPNLTCTDSSLNTICEETTKTACYEENVWSLDSCGNVDKQKQVCDYNAGFMCSKKSNIEAYCKDLNCNMADIPSTPLGRFLWKPVSEAGGTLVILVSGATGATIYGPDGKIIERGRSTGPSNGYDDTIRFRKKGSSYPRGSFVLTGGSRCYIKDPSARITTCAPLPAGINIPIANGETWCVGSTSVGGRFYKQTCINGKIETEPCADMRAEICDQNEEGGECIMNDWASCALANDDEVDSDTNSKVDTAACSEIFCNVWEPEFELEPITGILGDPVEPNEAVTEAANLLVTDLHLEMCVPKYPGGQQFWTATNSEGICSSGNYEATLYLDHDEGCGYWRLAMESDTGTYINQDTKWGYAALVDLGSPQITDLANYYWLLSFSVWRPANCEHYGLSPVRDNPLLTVLTGMGGNSATTVASRLNANEDIPDEAVLEMLDERCAALGDCAGKANWVGEDGIAESDSDFTCAMDARADHVKCEFEYECASWRAPSSGECGLCGVGGLQCSEYRCRALGQNCEYIEEREACVTTSDRSAPKITLESREPASDPIPPYTAAKFVISTNEMSECKFNLDSSGGRYSEMKYNFGKDFGTTHEILLNLPGQGKADEDTLAYALMKEGEHTLYVRCLDARGNGEAMTPFQIKFSVMQDPDKIPPVIQSFTPVSGSAIKFNTTEKNIRFKINEPSECRWELSDKEYALMNNSFSCDTAITDAGVLGGYYCSGILTNITTNLSQQTRFYIRCKDQPWLADNETILYKRNTNTQSTNYILRASQEFKITEVSPVGEIFLKNNENLSVELKAFTSGGGFNGKSICKWRLSDSLNFDGKGYTLFLTTGTASHNQKLNNIREGIHYVHVQCEDESGNIQDSFTSFTLSIDRTSPIISKIYEKFGKIIVKTNENAVCYVSNDEKVKCAFNSENATRMEGSEQNHETEWVFDKNYFIRCKDYYGNDNPNNCNIIARTY
ncbi:hypothetical protein FJZ17_03215 [Candidatus Pacearchaeota archaeon]|nr:hypothetical protein [Candidatus Pacearchaeota archaeon]